MTAISIGNKLSVLPAILAKNEPAILEEWIKEMSGSLRRTDLIQQEDLRLQCSLFLRQMIAALEVDSDFHASSWDAVRTILSDIS